MPRKLIAAAIAAAFALAIAAPAAPAASFASTLGRLSGAVKALEKGVKNIEDTDAGQTAAIKRVDKRGDAVVANLAALADKVNAITSAATTALAQINAALSDSTTGLLGLNLARPQYGAFTTTGAIIAGTGQVSGARGPSTNAAHGSGGNAGKYVVDFGNDVSKRFVIAQPFPGSGPAGFPQATVCSGTDGTTCQAVQGLGSPDQSPNHVLVFFGTTGGTAPVNGF